MDRECARSGALPLSRQRYLTTTASASSPPLACCSKIRSAIVCAAPPPASAGRDRAVDAVGEHHQQVAALQRHRRRAHPRHPVAEHAAEHQRDLLAQLGARADQPRVDVPDPGPRQRLAFEIEPGDGHHDPARVDQRLVAGLQQFLRVPFGVRAHDLAADLGGVGGLRPVPEPVDQAGQRAARPSGRRPRRRPSGPRPRTARRPPRDRATRATPRAQALRFHLISVTVVPSPGAVWMSNSSTSRRAPGSPRPSPPPVV